MAYCPNILRNLTEIQKTFGVGAKQVKTWIREGAPIAVEGSGTRTRYSAESLRLQCWREKRTSSCEQQKEKTTQD